MLGACLMPALVHAEPPADVRAQLFVLFDQAEQASEAKDYQKVKTLLEHADEIIGKRPQDFQDFVGSLGRATLQLRLASAIGDGKLGDACAHIALSRTYKTSIPDPDPNFLIDPRVRQESVATLTRQTDAEAARFGCKGPAKNPIVGTTDSAFVGHYYLTGVMEVGSELLLTSDGRFKWFVSSGAMDQTASGTWTRDASGIVLRPDIPDKNAPLFSLGEQHPWSRETERDLQQELYQRGYNASLKLCPFMDVPDSAGSIEMDFPTEAEQQKYIAALKDKIPPAVARVEALRVRAGQAGRLAFAATGGDREAQMSSATAAMTAWKEARGAMLDLYNATKTPVPQRIEPDVPKDCVVSDQKWVSDDPKDWTRGIIVNVADPSEEMVYQGAHVDIHFASGKSLSATTDSSGNVITTLRPETAIDSITIWWPRDGFEKRAQTFAIKPLAQGVQDIILNSKLLEPPPFTTKHYRIDGVDLIPMPDSGENNSSSPARYVKH
jgi:hypothetical protein